MGERYEIIYTPTRLLKVEARKRGWNEAERPDAYLDHIDDVTLHRRTAVLSRKGLAFALAARTLPDDLFGLVTVTRFLPVDLGEARVVDAVGQGWRPHERWSFRPSGVEYDAV